MRVHGILGRLAIGAILILGAGTAGQAKSVEPGEFRDRMMVWATESDRRFGTESGLAAKLGALSDEQIEILMSSIGDPEAFLAATERVVLRFAEQRAGGQEAQAGPRDASPGPTSESSLSLITLAPFPPSYPPNSGPYKTTIIDLINFFGIPATNTEGCGTTEWAGFVAVWYPLWQAIDALDGACVVAGCDPTGAACFIACGILETAKLALKVAETPLQACGIHGGAVDGAESEATYENVLKLLGSAELRRVHLQVLELAERKRYLVVATEAGAPVDVEFTAIQAFDEQAASFVNLSAATVTEVEPGSYVLRLNLPPCHADRRQVRHDDDPCFPDKVFRVQVQHDDLVNHPRHYGQVVFHRTASRGLATGQ